MKQEKPLKVNPKYIRPVQEAKVRHEHLDELDEHEKPYKTGIEKLFDDPEKAR